MLGKHKQPPSACRKQYYFRKPVPFSQYFILLIKSHGYYEIDCASWSESVIIQAEREEKRINPKNNVKIVTSPSDDDRVIQRIVREMNRHVR